MAVEIEKLLSLGKIPIVLIKSHDFDSFVMGYHVYKAIWTPFEKEELTAMMEPKNIEDKFAVVVKRNESVVGHLPKGKTGRFAKTIFYFLRANERNKCSLIVTGKAVNQGDGKGMKVPCKLFFSGEGSFINILKDQLLKNL